MWFIMDLGKRLGRQDLIDKAVQIALNEAEYGWDKQYGGISPSGDGRLGLIVREPAGVVACVLPWNFPLNLCFGPLVSALAAGNTVILKPSEIVPRTARVVAEAVAEMFDPLEVAVVTGGPELGAAVSAQPFDHLVFTGSTEVGKAIMRNASANLVPVTLELGGKSPVIVARSADLATAAFRIALSKTTNSGQVCINPDLVYVAREQLEAFPELRDKLTTGSLAGPSSS